MNENEIINDTPEVEHSKQFDLVKGYYDLYVETDGTAGWSKTRVARAVVKKWITADEYKEITGDDYAA